MHELPKSVPRRNGAVPDAAERPGEVPEPGALGAKRGEPVTAAEREAEDVGTESDRDEEHPRQ